MIRVGSIEEVVIEGANTAKMVEGGRKKKHILGGLDCSRPGSLAPALLYFMANDELPKASLRTFGMQLTRQQ
jgi:hypothetical protein